MTRAAHWDVAAYALGALDAEDVERFEEHLAGCWACAAELESLVPIVGLMSTVDILHLEDQPAHPQSSPTAADRAGGAGGADGGDSARMSDRVIRVVDADRPRDAGRGHGRGRDRHRSRSRRPLSITVVFLLLASVTSFSFFIGSRWSGADPSTGRAGPAPSVSTPTPEVTGNVTSGADDPGETGDVPSGVGGPEVDGEKFTTVDENTGVEADVVLEPADWGTQISFALRRLPGPMQCRLVVLRASGTAEVLSTWSVPKSGYGTREHPAPLLLQTATAAPRDDIDRVQIQAVDTNGVATALVTVPV